MKDKTNSHQMRCNIPDIHHKYLLSKTVVVNFTTASVCDLKEKKKKRPMQKALWEKAKQSNKVKDSFLKTNFSQQLSGATSEVG